ncbi:hypothetical protein [Novosphingobium sp. ZW T3_23]|uniref:hypothetical protein n=1 Tax=Novosphingobium sp. ZW T3_23 TaxID=3378084 RepID=UPI0038544507
MAAEDEVITVTAHRIDGSATGVVPSWSVSAVHRNMGTGQSRQITTSSGLKTDIKPLAPNDSVKLVVNVEGSTLTVVFTNLNGRDVQKTFANFFSVITSALDGSLMASVQQIKSDSQRNLLTTFVAELTADLVSAAANGRYLNIAGDTAIGNNYGLYGGIRSGGVDIDGDGQPNAYHTIKVDPNKIGSGVNERLNTTLLHELFHMLEGDGTTLDADYSRFGTNEAGHTTVYDRAASKIARLANKKEIDLATFVDGGVIQGISGTAAGEPLSMTPGYRGAFIEGYAGNDYISSSFSASVLDGGFGDDTYSIIGGEGRVAIFDDQGYDTIDFGASFNRSQLVVRLDNGWVELGINSNNISDPSIGDLTNVVIMPAIDYASNPIEQVNIGGQSFSMSSIMTSANTKPYLISLSEYYAKSTFRGGSLGLIAAADLDGDALTYSIIDKQGYASGSSWSITNGQLYVNATAPNAMSRSTITVRVSDGKSFSDTSLDVIWARKSDVSTDSAPANVLLAAGNIASAMSTFEAGSELSDYSENRDHFAGSPLTSGAVLSESFRKESSW